MLQELEATTLSHYRLIQPLAHGGMSVVYKAEDIDTQHVVAIKIVHRRNVEYYKRFRREVKILSQLKHPHILPVLESGECDSCFYMVMPYIAEGTLKQQLERRRLTSYEVHEIVMQLASALHSLHSLGIVHGDVKSSNILLDGNVHCFLADFGLAHHDSNSDETSQFMRLQGTPDYMAPELISQSSSFASDLYALGVVLYHMLTGQLPFKSSTAIGLYWRHRHEQPAPPSTYNAALSYAIDSVVLRALAKEPTKRFSSMQEFAQAYHVALCKHSAFSTSARIPVGTPVVVTVLGICILSSLMGFSFSYLTDHVGSMPALAHSAKVPAHVSSTPVTPPQQAHHTLLTVTLPAQRLLSAPSLLVSQKQDNVSKKSPTTTKAGGGQKHKKKRHKGKVTTNVATITF